MVNQYKSATRELARRMTPESLAVTVLAYSSRKPLSVTGCCVLAIYRAELARRAYQERTNK